MSAFHKLQLVNTWLISLIARLVKIMNNQIDSQEEPQNGKVMHIYEWSMSGSILFERTTRHLSEQSYSGYHLRNCIWLRDWLAARS
jgi:hypothetical protein